MLNKYPWNDHAVVRKSRPLCSRNSYPPPPERVALGKPVTLPRLGGLLCNMGVMVALWLPKDNVCEEGGAVLAAW